MAICGTVNGYNQHRLQKEVACDSCKSARAEYSRKWRSENPTKSSDYHKTYQSKSPDKVALSNKAWYQTNKEHMSEVKSFWAKNNLEKVRSYANKRRALKLSNGHSPYTEKDVLEKYGTDCHICLSPIDLSAPRKIGAEGWLKGLHLDHLTPLSKGGEDSLYNLRPAHGGCNLDKGIKILEGI